MLGVNLRATMQTHGHHMLQGYRVTSVRPTYSPASCSPMATSTSPAVFQTLASQWKARVQNSEKGRMPSKKKKNNNKQYTWISEVMYQREFVSQSHCPQLFEIPTASMFSSRSCMKSLWVPWSFKTASVGISIRAQRSQHTRNQSWAEICLVRHSKIQQPSISTLLCCWRAVGSHGNFNLLVSMSSPHYDIWEMLLWNAPTYLLREVFNSKIIVSTFKESPLITRWLWGKNKISVNILIVIIKI